MMLLDHLNKDSKLAVAIGCLGGYLCQLFLLDIKSFSWEFLIKGSFGMAFTIIGGFSLKVLNDWYTIRVKDKLFKTKNDAKTKESNERAA